MMDNETVRYYRAEASLALMGDQVIFGKDYRLNAFPLDGSGKPRDDYGESEHYWDYLEWLADYLHGREAEPDERQRDLCRIVSGMDGEKAMVLLGTYAACYEKMLVDTDTIFAVNDWEGDPESATEEDVRWILERSMKIKREYNEWLDSLPKEQVITGVCVHPLAVPASAESVRQYLDDLAEWKRMCDFWPFEPYDAGWRIPLSVVLREVDDRSARVRLLDTFYDWYREYASK